MNRIAMLTAEFAPNGVAYVPIEKLFDLRNGYTPPKSNASYWSGGTVPWIRMEDIRAKGRVLDGALQKVSETAVKAGKLFPANSLLVATSATIGEHALVTIPHLSNQRFTSLAIKAEYADQVEAKYLYYYGFILDQWCRDNTTTSSFSSVDMAAFKKFRFPIPPLEVQRELVRMLDQFTQLQATLETELERELEARRSQYVHYRHELLRFGPDTQMSLLGDVANNLDSRRKPVTKGERIPGDVPYYGASGVVDYVRDYIFEGDYLLVSEDGANLMARSTPIAFSVTGRTWVNNHAHVLEFPTRLDQRFVEIYLNSIDLSPFISGAAQPKLNKASLNRIPVPDPPFDEKRRVVGLLDELDALVNGLTLELAAEIAARRRQFGHFREKLLTFKKVAE